MDLKKIGVLIPHSKQYPTMSKEFMNGLRLSLPNSEYKFSIEGIGFGDKPQDIIDASQKLINQEEVVVTTGIIGHRGLDKIHDYFENMEEMLIYTDFGTTKPINLVNKQYIYCNSLDLYNATYSLGKHFIKKGFSNIGTSTCYYESGYNFIKALQESLYENEDAKFSGHFITPLHPRENESKLMTDFVNETKPDALFAFHNGIYAEEHASFLNQNKINTKTPLYTLPFSVDNKVLTKFPEIFNNTKSISSWFIDLDTKENKNFIQLYKQKYNKTPSVFSVLGYENGLLIQQKLDNTFSNENLIGPRGIFKNIDNRTVFKQHLWELKWKNDNYKFNCIETINQLDDIDYSDVIEENNWNNAYLCH